MKKILTFIAALLLFISAYAQPETTPKDKAIKLIEEALKNKSNAWNELKLIKHDKIDTLYILPTESKEYQIASGSWDNTTNNAGNDSTSYYIKAKTRAMISKDKKSYAYYQQKVDEWQAKSADNINQKLSDLADAVVNYTPDQKGWLIRCRILSNKEEQNAEFHFDLELSKVTDILSEYYARIYDKMRNVKTSTEFWELKKRFDSRSDI